MRLRPGALRSAHCRLAARPCCRLHPQSPSRSRALSSTGSAATSEAIDVAFYEAHGYLPAVTVEQPDSATHRRWVAMFDEMEEAEERCGPALALPPCLSAPRPPPCC